MKLRLTTLCLTTVLMVVASLNVPAIRAQDESSMQMFWSKFKAAVTASDKDSIAAMIQFPVAMPYGVRSIRNKAQLLRRYGQVFNGEANAVKCFANARPMREAAQPKEFTVGCDNGSGQEVVIYRFVWTKGGWKFKALDNINE